jgi:hypothetical protein
MTQLNKDISPVAYNEFLSDVATAVQQHRVQAIQSVQTISNQLYWNIGELIIKKQLEFGWGKSVILMLSQDLPQLIGEGVSWSPRNLQFMKQLVAEYSNVKQAGSYLEKANVKPTVSHLKGSNSANLNVKQAASHLENKKIKKQKYEQPTQHSIYKNTFEPSKASLVRRWFFSNGS